MTLQNLYLSYTLPDRIAFFAKREELRKIQPGSIIEAGLKEAGGFSLRELK